MSKKLQQHYIPRVYLKNFQIDDSENKSFVYCIDFSNKYNRNPQRKGINDKIFKEKKYYNDPRLVDSFAIEDVLAEKFEPKYDKIINSISKEEELSKEIIENLMIWLYISKMRSPYHRENTKRLLKHFIEITNGYNKHTPDEKEKQVIEKYIKHKSKEVHLNAFSDKEQAEKLIKLHIETLNAKHWRIIKSYPDFPFWTNDNPGFSPNTHPLFVKDFPFHQVMELNSYSIIFYVLTPKYCLEIIPFEQGTPLTVCAFNMKIQFEQATHAMVDFINRGVFYTRYKLLISNSKKLLDNCVKNKND